MIVHRDWSLRYSAKWSQVEWYRLRCPRSPQCVEAGLVVEVGVVVEAGLRMLVDLVGDVVR
jgi:hypothetical protein